MEIGIISLGSLLVISLLMALYFVPTFIAAGRRNFIGILCLNIFLGWTVVIWVACFIWACVSPRLAKPQSVSRSAPSDRFVAPRPRIL